MSEWISVKDRLPSTDETVLAIVYGRPRKNIQLVAACQLGAWTEEGWILDEYPEWETPSVTHWMPLPEPPEEARQ